jgi:hypothetical protein
LDRADTRLTLAAILLSAGTGAAVHLGQVSWIIALLLTLGWRAARHCQWSRAGAWLGIAVAAKPFLLVFFPVLVVRRRWSCLAAAALACVGSVVLGAAVFGWGSIVEWSALLRVGAPPRQVEYFINASLSAVMTRAGFGPPAGLVLGAALALMSLSAVRDAAEDETWLVTIACALLASPLGWIYYLPLATAPMISVAKAHRLPSRTWLVWPLLAFPSVNRDSFQAQTFAAITAGSVYAWGLLFIWICAVQAALASGPRVPKPVTAEDVAGR